MDASHHKLNHKQMERQVSTTFEVKLLKQNKNNLSTYIDFVYISTCFHPQSSLDFF